MRTNIKKIIIYFNYFVPTDVVALPVRQADLGGKIQEQEE